MEKNHHQTVRVRYAPSPTGMLHVGNARTALLNYIFTKHYQGKFILRVEDTDLKRNMQEMVKKQYQDLLWLGIKPDEDLEQGGEYGPYVQSQRLDLYEKYAQQLITEDKAYYCFCSAEALAKMRAQQKAQKASSFRYDGPCRYLSQTEQLQRKAQNLAFNVRLRIPINQQWAFCDLVRGPVSFESHALGDWIIMKSNGLPTYNFAVVIDDHFMRISHVIRGEEHLSNTPNQLIVFQALGWTPPQYAHLSLIVNHKKVKLSKRDHSGLYYIENYKQQGYLPQALVNYMALLGWSPADDQEIMTLEALISKFNEERFSKSSSIYDLHKLQWLNNFYIKAMDGTTFQAFIAEFLPQANPAYLSQKDLAQIALLYQPQLKFGLEMQSLLLDWAEGPKVNQAMLKFYHELKVASTFKKVVKKHITTLASWSEAELSLLIKAIAKATNTKGKLLFMPLRILLTGKDHGPSLAKIIYSLGERFVLKNLALYDEALSQQN